MSSNRSSVILPHSWRPVRLNQCCSHNVVRICCSRVLARMAQKGLTAQTRTRHPLKISTPSSSPSLQHGSGGQGRRRKHDYRQGHDKRPSVHSRVANSFSHALRGTKPTHTTACHCPTAGGTAHGEARYLMHVALLWSSTTQSGSLASQLARSCCSCSITTHTGSITGLVGMNRVCKVLRGCHVSSGKHTRLHTTDL